LTKIAVAAAPYFAAVCCQEVKWGLLGVGSPMFSRKVLPV
jgi:hypothetical protein